MLKKFEGFLESIPLEDYRKKLGPVKTVEQDLKIRGYDLNPLPLIYRLYWENQGNYPTYEEFFETYWKEHLPGIDEFIGKYFWGCSRDFVRLGLKARLYRTWTPVLTQFHFAYLWEEVCASPLEASADLDKSGVDFRIRHPKAGTVDISFKKISMRREASERRFLERQSENKALELVYTLEGFASEAEFRAKMSRARTDVTRLEHRLAFYLQRVLGNGFVIFRQEYPLRVESSLPVLFEGGKMSAKWNEVLEIILKEK